MHWLVAQSSEWSVTSLIGPLLIVFVGGAVLVVVVAILRRYLKAGDEDIVRDFSLGDLRRLKAEGKITQEELDRAKTALVERAQAEMTREPDPAGRKAGEGRAEVK